MAQLPVDPNKLLEGFKKAKERQELASTDVSFLKLDKAGIWTYGSEEIEVEEGSKWAINPATMATGFAAWDDSEKVGEEMAPITSDEPIIRGRLPDVGAAWSPQTAMQLKCLTGEDAGTEVLYSTTSKGGVRAFKALTAALIARMETGSTEIIPIVELEVDSYKHKKYGKIFTPELKVVDWMALDAKEAPTQKPEKAKDEGEEEDAEEAEEAEVVEPEEKPRRRRRQRA